MFPSQHEHATEFLAALESAGVAAAAWDSAGALLGVTSPLAGWAKTDVRSMRELVPELPDDYARLVGLEIELPLAEDNRSVGIRVGAVGQGTYVGIFTDLQERHQLSNELGRKTAALEEKIWELSRSKRAILNILEDLEERSRELAKGKEDLEELNEDLQRFNRELERANRELKGLDEVKSNLLSNVSHELRTPLVAIKGYSELIFREKLGPITLQQRAGLEISLKSLARLIDLINNLLDFSRIEIGRLQLEVETFSLDDVAQDVLGIISPRAAERNIQIYTAGLTPESSFVGDRNKIAQVLTNLLSNAVKFNKEEGRVDLTVEDRPDEVVLTVVDTGIGIAPENIGRIFDRFFQVDSGITRRQGGTGIGLSIVKSLVELHGGSIQVFSELSRGTTFLVRLPHLDEVTHASRS